MPLVGKWILLGFSSFLGVSANGLCQILSCSSSPQGDIVHWQIIDPVVTIALTNYQEIYFAPGDKVTFQAGGCVQTGGIGKTWKRYVDPSGPESGHLYYGTIQIPGLSWYPPARIKDVLNQTLTIPSTSGPVSTLSLGYVDDHYGDNGYWGHDDGTGNQCAGPTGGDAFVTLDIQTCLGADRSIGFSTTAGWADSVVRSS